MSPVDAALARLKRAEEMADREIIQRGLKGFRAEVTRMALVDHYAKKLAEESSEVAA